MNPGMIRTGVNFLSGSFVLDVLGLDIAAQSKNVSSFRYYTFPIGSFELSVNGEEL
jgi:hypothetical protein